MADSNLIFPDFTELLNLAKENKDRYQNAAPFPHAVFDNFFTPKTLDSILGEFPSPDEIKWRKFGNSYENKKLASRGEQQFGIATKVFAHYLNSAPFLSFLEELTGIPALIGDPFFDGGGLHQIVPGGYLKIHADFNKDTRTQLDRRLNVLIYLNKDWQESFGGHLELWDQEMRSAQVKILPLFNRLAVFSTTDTSYHGHPDPLKCPDDRTRKSFAAYYYSNGRPEKEVAEQQLPTVFRMRPGEEHLKEQEDRRWQRKVMKRSVVRFAKAFVPPILYGRLPD